MEGQTKSGSAMVTVGHLVFVGLYDVGNLNFPKAIVSLSCITLGFVAFIVVDTVSVHAVAVPSSTFPV